MADQPERLNIDNVLQRLLEVRGSRPGKNVQLSENEIRGLCLKGREVFLSQPILLELEAPLKICGDTHGQYYDLLRLFEYGGFPPESNYLFLGDYVDRGRHSLETISLLLAYKIKYPENFFILRGNHECASINRIYGFYDECKRRYNIKLWKTFTDCFNCLPVAAIVDEKIFCMHGGLSPDLQSMEQVRRIMRPTDVPDQGLLCDLLWSDPDKDIMVPSHSCKLQHNAAITTVEARLMSDADDFLAAADAVWVTEELDDSAIICEVFPEGRRLREGFVCLS
ncbi:hypothetical protein HPB49_016266 [Dermacentor silvarum]|uniref:Uncharacterized protein n=1 Tax=Dermacentor silvarum TaxID=543639 RepID=A0ACB8D6F4_DERSI|nr:hypothetical protein HPB49_016266 [Dermacentor silvarum]